MESSAHGLPSMVSYAYDSANRLTSMADVALMADDLEKIGLRPEPGEAQPGRGQPSLGDGKGSTFSFALPCSSAA